MSTKGLGVVDYILFALVLLCSSLIGIYFAYKQRKNASSAEYLVASRSLGWFPIFVSQLATFFSAIGVMGLPAQIYSTGITFCFNTLTFIIPSLLCCYVFGPMYRKMKLVSVNEYLEKRYSVAVRILSATLFLFQTNHESLRFLIILTIYLSIALYAPCLALESVAGVPIYVTILSTGVVCTFYTSLGGMRAVIWTDVFQSAIMFTGLIITMIVGVNQVGSISKIIEYNKKMDRLSLDFSFDPRNIHTVWGVLIGISCTSIPVFTVRQQFLQRFIAVKSLKEARIAMLATCIGVIAVIIILAIDALVIFTVYGECDLIISKKIRRNDQILPYFVIDKLSYLTGMTGLFTACLFSFSLSTLSSGLNAMSANFLEDLTKKIKPSLAENQETKISKYAALFGGAITTALAFVVPYLGKYVLRVVIQLNGIFGGPTFAIFALGMFTKTANKFGVLVGGSLGAFMGLFFSIGQLIYPPRHKMPPISIRQCSFFNESITNNDGIIYRQPPNSEEGFAKIFSISYVWIGTIPLITSLIFGYLISKCTSRYIHEEVDDRLLFDFNEIFIYRKLFSKKRASKYKVKNPSLDQSNLKEDEILLCQVSSDNNDHR